MSESSCSSRTSVDCKNEKDSTRQKEILLPMTIAAVIKIRIIIIRKLNNNNANTYSNNNNNKNKKQ